MSYDYSENILVQESAGHLLERELGWEVAFAYNTEQLGKDGTFGRTSYREILLTRYFRQALQRLNPWLTSAQLDEAAIRRLQDDLPDDEVLYDLAELFRVFGDSTRIKILYALFESELCVNDIAQVVGISQSAVSHQLRLLKTSKLVKFRREGKAMYYSLDDDHVRSMIALGMEHTEE